MDFIWFILDFFAAVLLWLTIALVILGALFMTAVIGLVALYGFALKGMDDGSGKIEK